MKIFNVKVWLFVALFFALFYSCEKDDTQFTPVDSPASLEQTYLITQKVLLKAMEEPVVRSFIKEEALKTVTYDYEVVYGMVKDQPLENDSTLESAFLRAEQKLLAEGEINASVVANLKTVAPLLSINVPNGVFGWDAENFTPPVIFYDGNDDVVKSYPALFADGHVEEVDPKNLPDYPIITIAENERMLYEKGKYVLDRGLIMAIAPQKDPGNGAKNTPIIECFFFGDEEICTIWTGGGDGGLPPGTGNDNGGGDAACDRGYGMGTYLLAIRMENVGTFENFGRPELRLRIFGGTNNVFVNQPDGQIIDDPIFNPDRGDINGEWWESQHLLYQWREVYGALVTYRWDEEDNPLFEGTGNIQFELNLRYGEQEYGVDFSFPRGNGDDYIGTSIVDKDFCEREYSEGALQFRLQF